MGVMKYLLFVLFPANGDAQYRVFFRISSM